jgi:hypothetical protein
VPGNKLPGKAAISPATVAWAMASATEPEAQASETAPAEALVRAIAPVVPILVTERVEAELIASAIEISLVAAAGIGMPSTEARGDIADRVRVATAVAAPPALGRVAAEVSVVAGAGEGRRIRCSKKSEEPCYEIKIRKYQFLWTCFHSVHNYIRFPVGVDLVRSAAIQCESRFASERCYLPRGAAL